MTKSPTVSVVMITYNHESFIAEAVQGVLIQQCEFDIELIISNDKSTDGTHDVIEEILEKDIPEHIHIRYYNHKDNKGMMSNFIWALQQAQGKYIALCEGDDYWTDPLKLQKQVDFLEQHQDCSFCFTKAKKVFEKQDKPNEIYPKTLKKDIYTAKEYLDFTTTATCSLLFRNLLKTDNIEFPSLKHIQGDFILYCHLLHFGKAGAINDVTCVYRKHPQGVSFTNSAKNYLFTRIKQLKIEKKYFTSREVKAAIDKQYVIHIKKFLKLYPDEKEKSEYLKRELLKSHYYYITKLRSFKKKLKNKLIRFK